jgi:hypothetical protein
MVSRISNTYREVVYNARYGFTYGITELLLCAYCFRHTAKNGKMSGFTHPLGTRIKKSINILYIVVSHICYYKMAFQQSWTECQKPNNPIKKG